MQEWIFCYYKNNKYKIISLSICLVAIFILHYFYMFVYISGVSMFPTLEDNDIILVKKTKNVTYNDIVVFQSPLKDGNYVKRIIGLPGDKIRVENNVVYVNNKKRNELDFIKNEKIEDCHIDITLDKSQFFVLGDNRSYSRDSRVFGPIKTNAIIGKKI